MKKNKISFVIPFKTDNGFREEIFHWNVVRLGMLFPGVDIIIGRNDDEPFNRSAARNDGFRGVNTEYVAFLDADTVWDPVILDKAVGTLDAGAPWVIPYMKYHVTDQKTGRWMLESSPSIKLDDCVEEMSYEHILSGPADHIYSPISGINVLRSDDMYKIGGFDESYVGWGWEDRAFAWAANKILGQAARFDGNIYHIWHPVKDTVDQPHYRTNEQRFYSYQRDFDALHKNYLEQ